MQRERDPLPQLVSARRARSRRSGSAAGTSCSCRADRSNRSGRRPCRASSDRAAASDSSTPARRTVRRGNARSRRSGRVRSAPASVPTSPAPGSDDVEMRRNRPPSLAECTASGRLAAPSARLALPAVTSARPPRGGGRVAHDGKGQRGQRQSDTQLTHHASSENPSDSRKRTVGEPEASACMRHGADARNGQDAGTYACRRFCVKNFQPGARLAGHSNPTAVFANGYRTPRGYERRRPAHFLAHASTSAV